MYVAQAYFYRSVVDPTPTRFTNPRSVILSSSRAAPGPRSRKQETPVTFQSEFAAGSVTTVAALMFATMCFPPVALADFSEKEYMPSIADKDYGKTRYSYPDFTQTRSGLQYNDMVVGQGVTFEPGNTAIVDWDGYTLGYYGRPFEARNKSKGGAFTGEDKDFFRFSTEDAQVIPAFREAVVGMKVGTIRRVIVPSGSKLGYPPGKRWKVATPTPSNFSGQRALGFVLENEGMIDKTLMFDIELIRVDEMVKN